MSWRVQNNHYKVLFSDGSVGCLRRVNSSSWVCDLQWGRSQLAVWSFIADDVGDAMSIAESHLKGYFNDY